MITLNDNDINQMLLLRYQLYKTNIPKQLIDRGLKYLDIKTENEAKELLMKNKRNKWSHPFVYKANKEYKSGDLCLVCRQKFINHSNDNYSKRSHSLSKPDVNNGTNRSIEKHYRANKRRVSLPDIQMPIAIQNLYNYCPICLDNDCNEMQALLCSHAFCLTCFVQYIQNQINHAKVEKINCPEKNCEFIIDEELFLNLIDEDYKARYRKYKRRNEIEKGKDAIFCPYPDCESYALYSSINIQSKAITDLENIMINFNNDEILTCIENHHQFCAKCHQMPHYGENCKARLDRGFEEWKKKAKTKKCPQCKTEIEKIGGCNHMTCTKQQCGYQFCWICMGKYTQHHYSNPLTPCFRLEYSQKESFCIKCRVLFIVLRLIGIILLFFLLLGLVFAWPSLLITISSGIVFSESLLEKGLLVKLTYIATFFFLSIALIPIGFVCLFGFISALPVMLITGGVYLLQELYLSLQK